MRTEAQGAIARYLLSAPAHSSRVKHGPANQQRRSKRKHVGRPWIVVVFFPIAAADVAAASLGVRRSGQAGRNRNWIETRGDRFNLESGYGADHECPSALRIQIANAEEQDKRRQS